MVQDTFLPLVGGAEIHVANLSKALSDMGHSVTVVTTTPGDAVEQELVVHRFPFLSTGGRRAWLSLPRAIPSFVRLIRANDVIHCHYSFFLSAVFSLLGWRCRPVVVTLHGLGTLDSSVGRSWMLRSYRYVSLKLAGAVIATSSEMADVAKRFAPSGKILSIPNGVWAQPSAPLVDEPTRPTQIAAVRRLVPKNGVQYLVQAAPEIVRCLNGHVMITVVGDGPLRANLELAVESSDARDHVQFLGAMPNVDARRVIDGTDIVVFPSSAESTSIAALEAMACGKAIVASAIGGFLELVGDDERGLLVRLFERGTSDYEAPSQLPARNIEALVAAIVRLAVDPVLRRTLGGRAREFVRERFDWRIVAGRVERCYLELTLADRPGESV